MQPRNNVAATTQPHFDLHPPNTGANFTRVTPPLWEANMTLSTKVGYVVTCLAFLFVGAVTVGLF
jgi:hypothetical protein